MRRLTNTWVLALLVAASGQAQTIAITGGRVYPVSGPAIERGTVVIRDGRIAAVGANVEIPADAQRVDATGKIVTLAWSTPRRSPVVETAAFHAQHLARGKDGIAAAFTVGRAQLNCALPPARMAGARVFSSRCGWPPLRLGRRCYLVPGTPRKHKMRVQPRWWTDRTDLAQSRGNYARCASPRRSRAYARRKALSAQTRPFAAGGRPASPSS
jgi:hypothetical protein